MLGIQVVPEMDGADLSWKVEEVLPEEDGERDNVPVYAADIPEPKLASPILRALGDAHPLPRLTHVKRIRNTQDSNGVSRMSIVICPTVEAATALGSHPVVFPDVVAAVMEKFHLTPFLAEVPGRPARTLEESKEDCKLWPVTFHPNREGAGPVKEELTPEDLQSMWRFMQAALHEAKRAADCGQPRNGCVIVDPVAQRIVASGFDCSGRQDASSESRAHLQRPQPGAQPAAFPGASETPAYSPDRVPTTLPADLDKPSNDHSDNGGRLTEAQATPSGVTWHPLKHAAIVAVDSCARADNEQFPDFGRHSANISCDGGYIPSGSQPTVLDGNGLPQTARSDPPHSRSDWVVGSAPLDSLPLDPSREEEGGVATGAEMGWAAGSATEAATGANEEKRRKVDSSNCRDVEPKGGLFVTKPYLCTGFDAYLVREPCTMCAMALVHSRIRRVVYGVPNTRTGALGGRYNLQTKKSLNHHYKVFQMSLVQTESDRMLSCGR